MHTISKRELDLELTNEEVVTLAMQMASVFEKANVFTGFALEVEEIPANLEADFPTDGYALLVLHILSSVETEGKPGVENGSDNIIVDKSSDLPDDMKCLVKRGNELKDLLLAQRPAAKISTLYPRFPAPEAKKRSYPEDATIFSYQKDGCSYSVSTPTTKMAIQIMDMLKDASCEIGAMYKLR